MRRIKKNDLVAIIAGDEKGKTGKILRFDVERQKVFVEKLNLVKRHVRPTQKNPKGGVIEKEAPIHMSNVMPVCPKCKKGARVTFKYMENKAKVRICKTCGEMLDRK